MNYALRCKQCGIEYASSFEKQTCERCGGILEVIYHEKQGEARKLTYAKGFWDFEPLLPNGKYKHFAVGMTKIVPSNDNDNLFFKFEFDNPTHSFKDRGSVIEVAKAKEYGFDKIACASTGNMAYSISYYAKLYGIEATVFISKGANRDKLIDIKSTHDAELHLINGDFTAAQKEAERYAQRNDAFLGGDYCYRKEGQSTIAYELFLQARDAKNIIVPVGNATLFTALYKAYTRMKTAGLISTMPRLFGVEASGCSPLYKAAKNATEIKYEKPKTFADAIAVGFPTYGSEAIEAARLSKGEFITVSDKEMRSSQQEIYKEYGVKVELASAAGLEAYEKLCKRNTIGKEQTVIILSGSNI
ncbi:MAG: threonine synthase [Candidatus Micrarchaeia archaeon]